MEAHLQQQPKREPLNVPPGETFDVEDDYPVIMFGSGCKEH
jgi:hypothetical protein